MSAAEQNLKKNVRFGEGDTPTPPLFFAKSADLPDSREVAGSSFAKSAQEYASMGFVTLCFLRVAKECVSTDCTGLRWEGIAGQGAAGAEG
jgi:hypothetical protein